MKKDKCKGCPYSHNSNCNGCGEYWAECYENKKHKDFKEHKALEIIKRLPADYIKDLVVFIREFPNDTFYDFIAWGGDETPILINEEEYDVFKEVLL